MIIWLSISTSSHLMVDQLVGTELTHWIQSIGIIVGLGASAIGISYFSILKVLDNRDKEKEYDVFLEDIKNEIEDLTKSPDKYIISWNEQTKTREGRLGVFALDTFSLFNNKYRHLFNKKTRADIGALNIKIQVSHRYTMELGNIEKFIIFDKQDKIKEYHASINRYNAGINEIKKSAMGIKNQLDNYKKTNWLHRIFRTGIFSNSH